MSFVFSLRQDFAYFLIQICNCAWVRVYFLLVLSAPRGCERQFQFFTHVNWVVYKFSKELTVFPFLVQLSRLVFFQL